jgi:hypothetical protein
MACGILRSRENTAFGYPQSFDTLVRSTDGAGSEAFKGWNFNVGKKRHQDRRDQ